MEDIDARDVKLLTGSGEGSQTHGKVTSVGSVQRQLNDDDITVKVEVGEFVVHVRKCSRVDVGRTTALGFTGAKTHPMSSALGEK